MDLVPNERFFSWLATTEVRPDDRYQPPSCLAYVPHRNAHRFWCLPHPGAAIPYFVQSLLDGLDPWFACYVWPRDGEWPVALEEDDVAERVRGLIVAGAGVPAGFAGAVRFTSAEADRLAAVVFAHLTFGWSVPDDLFIIPDHARQLLQTDHHDVVHVEFAEEGRVAPYIEHMKRKGYDLPAELPDWTFRKPDWMR
jgi:hypothetical protein